MKLLAFDTSTEHLSIAVQNGSAVHEREEVGGRHASAALIPLALELLQEAGVTLTELDAIVFGRGPGSFTGLRTACSVAQGLAYGAELQVLPLDTLLAVAEDARTAQGCTRVLALLDARMDEVYAAPCLWQPEGGWKAGAAQVCAPEDLATVLAGQDAGAWTLAGNAMPVYGARFPVQFQAWAQVAAWPRAAALLRLAPAYLAAGKAVPPEQALPVYVRDKVARTVAERAASAA